MRGDIVITIGHLLITSYHRTHLPRPDQSAIIPPTSIHLWHAMQQPSTSRQYSQHSLISYCIIMWKLPPSTFAVILTCSGRGHGSLWASGWGTGSSPPPPPPYTDRGQGLVLKCVVIFFKIELINLIYWDFQCQCVDEQNLPKKSEGWRGTYFAGGPV